MARSSCVPTCPLAPRPGVGLTMIFVTAAVIGATLADAAVIEVAPGDSIQAVIDDPLTNDGDVIVLAPGTYYERINLRGRALTVRSTDPADPLVVAATILDGDGGGSVVTCWGGEGPDTVIAGLTITDGFFDSGGGMYVEGSSPTVVGCRFVDNEAFFDGGGLYCLVATPTVIHCTFEGNKAFHGGGVANILSSPLLYGCVFTGNNAFATGGGVDNFNDSNSMIANCTFNGNDTDDGGAVANDRSSPTIANCVLWGDRTPTGVEIHNAGGSDPTVRFSDVAGSGGSDAWDATLGTDGGGNVDVDPAFVDAAGPDGAAGTGDENLRLAAGSAAIDAGRNADVPPDVADLDGDGDTLEPTPSDPDGHQRFADDPGTIDTGEGDSPLVDMGPYELAVTVTCTGDLDGDGQIGHPDLVRLIGAWGQCNGCPEDFNGDGRVNFRDLLRLLFSWGPCEETDAPKRPKRRRHGKRWRCRR